MDARRIGPGRGRARKGPFGLRRVVVGDVVDTADVLEVDRVRRFGWVAEVNRGEIGGHEDRGRVQDEAGVGERVRGLVVRRVGPHAPLGDAGVVVER